MYRRSARVLGDTSARLSAGFCLSSSKSLSAVAADAAVNKCSPVDLASGRKILRRHPSPAFI